MLKSNQGPFCGIQQLPTTHFFVYHSNQQVQIQTASSTASYGSEEELHQQDASQNHHSLYVVRRRLATQKGTTREQIQLPGTQFSAFQPEFHSSQQSTDLHLYFQHRLNSQGLSACHGFAISH